jgi:PTH1 family peptidyl-tRNA hydrolase
MKLIVGLGNPGRRYEQTRHNIGFMVASRVACLIGADSVKTRFDGEVAEGVVGAKLVVLWPQTYMNASGKSVRKACDFYKLTPDDVLVVCDDLNLPTGRLRFRANGSSGGQKGLADILRHLGTEQVARLRIGIDRPPAGWDPTEYVLGKFTEEQRSCIDAAVDLAAKAAIDWSTQGIQYVMCRYNAEPVAKDRNDAGPSKTADSHET